MSRTLHINECFFSIQGESTHAGRPCSFVRLMGCPLRCTYCDTEYAFHEGQKKTFDEIFGVLEGFGCNLVEVTGGEPLAQPNCIPFLGELVERGYEVLIETSGAYPIAKVPAPVAVILDVKTPGSGEKHRVHWDNMGALKPGLDEVKFVLTSREDFDYAVGVCAQYNLLERNTVLLSPSFGKLDARAVADWILESRLPFRMQVQMHKFIWEPATRGV